MNTKTCCLCRNKTKLINAHIIPKWVFKYLYPNEVDSKKESVILLSKNFTKRRPIGPYDDGILCEKCDNFLGVFDDYAKKILLNSLLEERGNAAYVIKNVDFKKIRLFLISMTWRAAISDIEEFNEIKLGSYKDKIREILANELNGLTSNDLDIFSFVITKFSNGTLSKDVVERNISLPYSSKINGINVVIFYLPKGIKIYLKIDKRKFDESIEKVATYFKEGLLITKAGDYSESKDFQRLLKTIDLQKYRER